MFFLSYWYPPAPFTPFSQSFQVTIPQDCNSPFKLLSRTCQYETFRSFFFFLFVPKSPSTELSQPLRFLLSVCPGLSPFFPAYSPCGSLVCEKLRKALVPSLPIFKRLLLPRDDLTSFLASRSLSPGAILSLPVNNGQTGCAARGCCHFSPLLLVEQVLRVKNRKFFLFLRCLCELVYVPII